MLNNVQVLRGIAALFVVIVHLAALNKPLLAKPFAFGLYGVDLFFVISGLVMVYTTSKKNTSPGQFFANRLIRIAPLYWMGTIMVFFVAVVAPSLVNGATSSPIELLKSLLFIPYMKQNGEIHPLLFPGWTLNYEMFFYALFATSLWIKFIWARVLAVLAVLVGLGAVRASGYVSGTVLRFYTDPIILEFGYGMIIGLLLPLIGATSAKVSLNFVTFVAGLLFIVVAPSFVDIGDLRAFIIGIPAALVVLSAVSLDIHGRSIRSSSLLLIGAASYSLYLTHAFVLVALEKTAIHAGINHGAWLLPLIVIMVAAAIAVAIVVHMLFERPVERALRLRFSATTGARYQDASSALWPWQRWALPSFKAPRPPKTKEAALPADD